MQRCQCPSVCDGSARVAVHAGNTAATPASEVKAIIRSQQTWPPPMEGSSHAMTATSRPSFSVYLLYYNSDHTTQSVQYYSNTLLSTDSAIFTHYNAHTHTHTHTHTHSSTTHTFF